MLINDPKPIRPSSPSFVNLILHPSTHHLSLPLPLSTTPSLPRRPLPALLDAGNILRLRKPMLDSQHSFHNSLSSQMAIKSEEPREKKPRIRHSEPQLAALNALYEENEHPTLEERAALATSLNMYVLAVAFTPCRLNSTMSHPCLCHSTLLGSQKLSMLGLLISVRPLKRNQEASTLAPPLLRRPLSSTNSTTTTTTKASLLFPVPGYLLPMAS